MSSEAENESPHDTTPLLPTSSRPDSQNAGHLDRVGLQCLLVQHFSSAWGDRTAEFALYLYLIIYYQDTLLPSSILGFSMTLSGIAWSHWAGSLIDKYDKLRLVRVGILVQKLSALCAYTSCGLMFAGRSPPENPLTSLRSVGRRLFSLESASASSLSSSASLGFVSPLFALLVASACIIHLSNICISIAVERDWATCIAGQGPHASKKLSKVNTYLRQINLLCKLCAPLFVSFLTVRFDDASGNDAGGGGFLGGGMISLKVLSIVSVVSMVFELYWIGVVYRRFPELKLDQERRNQMRRDLEAVRTEVSEDGAREYSEEIHQEDIQIHRSADSEAATSTEDISSSSFTSGRRWGMSVLRYFQSLINIPDWKELIHLPVFFSSVAVSLLYITVLSFDGIMVGYLKMLSFSDDLIAEMRGISVVTGLLGTALALPLENKIGSVRAGNWSIWSMVLSLIPVLVTFYVFAPENPGPSTGHPAVSVVGAVMLFGGMAISRIGLWSFDLIQTKQLQTALTTHPRRNALTALQYTMQNVASLFKFMLTMILWRPAQFRWAATASFASVSTGALVYMVYVKKERGHVVHGMHDAVLWMKKIL